MKSIDAVSRKAALRNPAQFAVAMAKNLLLSRLTKIEIGHLSVEEGGDLYTFGQSRQDADIIARIIIKDPLAYPKILFNGSTGSGEAYMQGAWSSPDLVKVVRLFVANKHLLSNMESGWSWLSKFINSVRAYLHLNTKIGSKKNISAHYDLSNHFFSLFLDRTMMYSSALFPCAATSLEEASLHKLHHICRRLNLSPRDHLLEIGTGWGGMAVHAAKHYGCKVTTTTISQEQYELARQRVEREGLSDKVTVLKKDYRELTGTFDKLVSIEMVEAVGHQYYREFFTRCSKLLKRNGLMLMQAITTQDQRFEREKNRSDFIRKYIFPGGCLPSNEVVMRKISQYTDMHLVGLEDITADYAKTLNAWRRRFFNKIDEVRQLGFDDIFIRMWDFYLCYCEGGFSERVINTSQFLFAKPQCRELPVVGAGREITTTSVPM